MERGIGTGGNWDIFVVYKVSDEVSSMDIHNWNGDCGGGGGGSSARAHRLKTQQVI